MSTVTRGPAKRRKSQPDKPTDHVGDVVLRDIDWLIPSPENDGVYTPVDVRTPANVDLTNSIKTNGLIDPIVTDRIGNVVSGHRRLACAREAGLHQVPCRVLPILRDDYESDEWTRQLTMFNKQREKTFAEVMREAVVEADRDDAYVSLISHRRQKSGMPDFADTIKPIAVKMRKKISRAKWPMLAAVQNVVNDLLREFWPLSARQIHYVLVEQLRPLRHASKPNSTYVNDDKSHCYNDLTDLITRARIAGLIPWEAIGDETRPIVTWDAHQSAGDFIRKEIDGFLKNYWRNLQQSQTNWLEIVGEKLTLNSIIRPVAAEYCIPFTIGRGFCSLSPRHDMLQRFLRSGREKLIILILSDHDPAGLTIAESFARSMRDDFGLKDSQVLARKVALTPAQIAEHRLPRGQKATDKKASTRTEFIRRYGEYAFELEALQPKVLQKILRDSIDEVLDVEAFNHELDREKDDAQHIDRARQLVHAALAQLDLTGEES